jgi:Protein of unknown function (DUF3105)
MVSGKTSKAARSARPKVVQHKATPWGLIAGITVVALFAAAVFGYAFLRNQENEQQQAAVAQFTPSETNQDPSTQIQGVVVQEYGGGLHVSETEQVAYTHSPPFGGAHDGGWAACNGVVYPQPVRSENLVHSLEHGAVWIAYNPEQITGPARDTLSAKVDGKPYMVMSPYPGLDSPISLQSWGHQLKLSDPNDPRIDQFIAALRVNQYQHPEPGASCAEIGARQQPGYPEFFQDNPPPFAPPPAPGTPGSVPETGGSPTVAPDGMGG